MLDVFCKLSMQGQLVHLYKSYLKCLTFHLLLLLLLLVSVSWFCDSHTMKFMELFVPFF